MLPRAEPFGLTPQPPSEIQSAPLDASEERVKETVIVRPARPEPKAIPQTAPRVPNPVSDSVDEASLVSSSSPSNTLGVELGLLEKAKEDLLDNPTRALAHLAQHRAQFPAGALSQERDLMILAALRRTGRTAEARSAALAWLDRDPAGPYASRVRAIVASLSP